MRSEASGCCKCERNNKKNNKKSVLRYLQEFSNSTTLHGIRYIGESDRHPIERLCWAVAVVVCAVGCGLQIQALWARWQTSPVIVSLAERSTAIWDIPFPALTVCPENKVRRSHFDIAAEMASMRDRRQLDNLTFIHTSLSWQAASMVCSKIKDPFTSGLNESHVNILKTMAPSIDDAMTDCKWGYKELGCLTLFRTVLTDEGICFTFNMLENQDLFTALNDIEKEPVTRLVANSTWDSELGYPKDESTDKSYPRRAVGIGPNAGLNLLLKVRPGDMQPDCNGDAQSFKLMVHAVSEFPQVSGQYLRVPLDSTVTLAVRPNLVTTAPGLRHGGHAPPVRGCYFPQEKNLKYFKVYTQENCEIECIDGIIREFCSCQPFYMPKEKNNNLTFCTEENFNCIRLASDKIQRLEAAAAQEDGMAGGKDSVCKCLPSCTEQKYELELSSSQFDIRNDRRDDVNASQYRYIALSVFFKDIQFIRSHRSELYGITDFLANCGGLLGLFTGFSVISAVEVFYFASLRLACHLRRRHRCKIEKLETQ